eukprot:129428-Karenia_brevis.AAC.1
MTVHVGAAQKLIDSQNDTIALLAGHVESLQAHGTQSSHTQYVVIEVEKSEKVEQTTSVDATNLQKDDACVNR